MTPTVASSGAAESQRPAGAPTIAPFSDHEVANAIGQVFQRVRDLPSTVALDEGAGRHQLNGDATRALAATAQHRVTVVHGPPGTGKTVFSVATMD
eukprot:5137984-Pyramimonas_sp.AAC.1